MDVHCTKLGYYKRYRASRDIRDALCDCYLGCIFGCSYYWDWHWGALGGESMTSEIVSVLCGNPDGPEICTCNWDKMGHKSHCPALSLGVFDNSANEISPCAAYQKLLESCTSDVIIYIHDDVTIHDPDWLARVMALFENPNCVAVGLGGATALGSRDLYRKPYNIWNMARRGYASNQTDAETHGERFTGERRVACIEQFFMAIRTDWLRTRRTLGPLWYVPPHAVVTAQDVQSGWPTLRLTHHMMDGWLACEAARHAKEIWMTGISCTHHGGGSSTTKEYAQAKWLQGGTMESDHQIPHRWLWEEYRDVLPLEVGA